MPQRLGRAASAVLGVVIVLMLNGCASRAVMMPDRSLPGFMAQEARLWDTALPLLGAAAMLCKGEARMHYGVVLYDSEHYRKMYKGDASVTSRPEGIRVRYVHPRFPAAATGIKAGDKLLAIN